MLTSRYSTFGWLAVFGGLASSSAAQTLGSATYVTPGSVLERRAELDISDVPLARALALLAERSRVPVAFSPSLVAAFGHRVSCNCREATVRAALDRLFRATMLAYTEERGQIVVFLQDWGPPGLLAPLPVVTLASSLASVSLEEKATGPAQGSPPAARDAAAVQAGSVSGVVTDRQTLKPIAGADVSVVETAQRATTDAQGRFRVENVARAQATLRVASIGYTMLEQVVSVDERAIRIALAPAVIELNEIVVTGTAGGTEKRAIGNSVARIDAAQAVQQAPVLSLSDLVTGRTAGLMVQPGGGVAGAGSRIRIRGTASLTLDTQPLIYVDGVRVDNAVATGPSGQGVTSRLNDFDPDDIESIEIIKGPAAATLYGTEAASGVIQIITKKGKRDQLDIDVTMRQGATWFPNPEGRFVPNWYRGPETGGELQSLNVVESEKARGNPIFRVGHLQSYGANLSGGGRQATYYVAGDFDRDEGVEDPNVSSRYSGRANVQVTARPSLDVAANLGVTLVRSHLVPQLSPTQSVIGATKRASPRLLNTPSRGFFALPPEVIWEAFNLTQGVDRFTGSLQLNHRPTTWFSHRVTVGGDFVHEDNESFTPKLRPDLAQFFSTQAAQGSKSVNRRDVTYTTLDYSGTASYRLGALALRTSLGGQLYRRFTQTFSATGQAFPLPGVETVASAAIRNGGDDFVENVTVGTYVQQEVSRGNRLFLTAALRGDDNSAFGKDYSFQKYPKVSASWVVSEEPFWNVGLISVLRLRAAYGASGQQPDAFAAIRTFEPVTGTNDQPSATPQSLGNSKLGPERGEELELGFESELLGGRAGMDFTAYRQTTRDAILLAPVAPSTGFPGSRYVNAGEVRNRGIELLLRAQPIDARQFGWDLTLNLSANDNKIVSLGGLPTIGTTGTAPGGPVAEHREGYAPYSFFVKKVVHAEFDSLGKTVNVLCDGGPENNHEPMACDIAPRVYVGKMQPDAQGSLRSGFTFRGHLRLDALFDFQAGKTNFAEDNWVICSVYRICHENYEPLLFDPIRVAEIERAGSNPIRSIYYNDASFIKFRELSLSYNLPEGLARKMGAQRASITVAGRNLYTWTQWTQLDPESSSLPLPGGGFDQSQAPQMAQATVLIHLTF